MIQRANLEMSRRARWRRGCEAAGVDTRVRTSSAWAAIEPRGQVNGAPLEPPPPFSSPTIDSHQAGGRTHTFSRKCLLNAPPATAYRKYNIISVLKSICSRY